MTSLQHHNLNLGDRKCYYLAYHHIYTLVLPLHLGGKQSKQSSFGCLYFPTSVSATKLYSALKPICALNSTCDWL